MDNTKKENLKVVLKVESKEFNNKGEVINAIEAGSKLTKADAGRISQKDEDSINISASTCGVPTIEGMYHSKSIGKGETKTEVEFDLKGQTLDMTKGELIDAIASSSKLTKADAGRELDKAIEDLHTLKAEKHCDAVCTTVQSHYSTKTVDA